MITTFSDVERKEIESVKGIVQQKLRELLSDLPVDTYSYFKDCILTGGCFASLLLSEEVHDWDIYLKDIDTANKFESFVMSDSPSLTQVAEVTPGYMTPVKVSGKLVTPNAVTFKNGLQVITLTDKTHRETFDFVHCMPYFDMATQQLFISRQQYDAIKKKKLIHNPQHSDGLCDKRVGKLVDRGWKFVI